MVDQSDQPTEKPTKSGYAKRPIWQWVLIYLVVAVVVYGLIYFLFFRNNSSY